MRVSTNPVSDYPYAYYTLIQTMSQTANYTSGLVVPYAAAVPIIPVSAVYYPVVVQYHPYAYVTAAKGPGRPQQLNTTQKKTESPWNKLFEKPKKPSPWDTLLCKEKAKVEKSEEKNSRHVTGHCSFTIETAICQACHPSHHFHCTTDFRNCGCWAHNHPLSA